MPRYFFHTADRHPVHHEYGLDFGDDGLARVEALRHAGELVRRDQELLTNHNQLHISVIDEGGVLPFTVVTVVADEPQIQRRLTAKLASE